MNGCSDPCENLRSFSGEFRKSRLKTLKTTQIRSGTTVAKSGLNVFIRDQKAGRKQ